MLEVLLKTDEAIELIDQSDTVKRLKQIKEEISTDVEVQKLIKSFKKEKIKYEKDLIITDSLIESKEKLYNHPLISEYRKLYSNISLAISFLNSQIQKLLNYKKKDCNNRLEDS